MKTFMAIFCTLAACAAAAAQEPIEALVAAAQSHEAEGRIEEAIGAWKSVSLRCGPKHRAEAHMALARLWAIMQPRGRFDDFEASARSVLEAQPGAGFALAFLGLVQHNRGRDEDALETYSRIIELGEPEAGWAAYNMGSILIRDQKNQIEAADAYVESLRLAPGFKDSLGFDATDRANNVALQLVAWRMFDEARRVWESMLALPGIESAKRARVCFYVAMLDYREGLFAKAEGSLLAAMELAPDDPEYVSNLGLVYLSWGKEEKALQEWHRCLSMNENYADAIENLGCFWMRRGDTEKSIRHFSHGMEIARLALDKASAELDAARSAGSNDQARLDDALKAARLRLFRFETHLRNATAR